MQIQSDYLEVTKRSIGIREALGEIEKKYSGFVMVVPHCAGGYDFANKDALPPEIPVFETIYKDQEDGHPSAEVMLKMLHKHGYSMATTRYYTPHYARDSGLKGMVITLDGRAETMIQHLVNEEYAAVLLERMTPYYGFRGGIIDFNSEPMWKRTIVSSKIIFGSAKIADTMDRLEVINGIKPA